MTDTSSPQTSALLAGVPGATPQPGEQTPGEPRARLRELLQALGQAGHEAAISVLGSPGYTLRTADQVVREEPETPPPADALLLQLDGRPLGWVQLAGDDPGAALVRDLLASSVQSLLLHSHAAHDSQRQRAALESVYSISAVAAGAASVEPILEAIFEHITRFMPVEAFVAALYDERQHEIALALNVNYDERLPISRLPADPQSSLSAWVIVNRQSLLVRDLHRETLPTRPRHTRDKARTRSLLAVPMEAQGQVVGMLSVQSQQPGAYGDEDLRLLTQLAQQAALAILTQQGRAAYEQRLHELSALNELSRELSAQAASMALVELLELIRVRLGQLINTANFYVALYDEASNMVTFALATEDGVRKPWAGRQAGHGLTEHLLQRAAPLRIAEHVDAYLASIGIQSIGRSASCWLGVPLWIGGRPIGVMVLQEFEEGKTYSEEDERLLVAAAAQVAGVVQTVRLLEEEQRQRNELQEANQRQAELLNVIRELSAPVVPILEGVLALPLIGSLDSRRAAQIMDDLLHTIERQRAEVVLLDITGVPLVDTSVANYLLQTIKAVQLLGARCVLVGIRPEVAQTIVGLGVDMRQVATLASLQEGVAYALSVLGRRIVARSST